MVSGKGLTFNFYLIIKINKMATAFKKMLAKKHSDSSDSDSSSEKPGHADTDSHSDEELPQAQGSAPEAVSACLL